jgi:hypothetical protein
MSWLQENWFKIGILIVAIAFVSVYYLINVQNTQNGISNQQRSVNSVATTTTSLAISQAAEPAAMAAASTSNYIKSPVVKEAQTLPNADSKSSSNEITQDEVAPFKKAIFKVICFKNGDLNSTGSGFAMDMPGAGKVLITNE